MGKAKRYDDISDLPEEEVSTYSRNQKAAFKRAWNRAADRKKDEHTALREARLAARQEGASKS